MHFSFYRLFYNIVYIYTLCFYTLYIFKNNKDHILLKSEFTEEMTMHLSIPFLLASVRVKTDVIVNY